MPLPRPLFAFPIALALCAIASPTHAGNPTLRVTSGAGSFEDLVDLEVRLDIPSFAIGGWSFGIEHDPIAFSLALVVDGETTATVNGGSPPDFNQVNVLSNGFTTGVVVSFIGTAVLPAGENYELNVATYEVHAVPSGVYPVCPTSGLGSPPVMIQVAASGSAFVIDTLCGEIEVDPPAVPWFIRGDCNGTGFVDVADAVYILQYLFGSAAEPTCFDACDASDGGTFDVADAVRILEVLFLGAGPFDPPFPDCGIDPTGDAVPCESSPVCP